MDINNLTEAEVAELAELVNYEMHMLGWCLNQSNKLSVKAQTSVLSKDQEMDKNAMLEAFLLHARNLRDFLYGSKIKHEDDLCAEDFVADPKQWEQTIATLPNYLEENREKVNSMLAHISAKRLRYKTPDKKPWDCIKIARELTGAWQKFLEQLPQNRRKDFVQVLNKLN